MAFVSPLSGSLRAPTTGVSAQCARRVSPRMATGTYVTEELTPDDAIVFGVAKCFRQVKSRLHEVLVFEPVSSASLHCVAQLDVPTSYLRLWRTRIGDAPDRIDELPEGVIKEGESVSFADAFAERTLASARTYRRSPEIATLIPENEVYSDINHSIERKRILDAKWEPDFSDNVKQDMSIDVYDRDDEDPNVKQLYNM